jgi:hypothetical protein
VVFSCLLLFERSQLTLQANVLINHEGQAVLVDFGLVFIIDSCDFTSVKSGEAGRWTAPELLTPPPEGEDGMQSFSLASDIFSLAMTIIEVGGCLVLRHEVTFNQVYSGTYPFPTRNDTAVIFDIESGKRPDVPPFLHSLPVLESLVQLCWKHDPKLRPSVDDVCSRLDPVSILLP